MLPEIAVVGAGTMGAGIAQLALEHGHPVRLIDLDRTATERARSRITDGVGRRLLRRGQTVGTLASARARILARLQLGVDVAEAAAASLVIEAVVERLDVKQALFARLDRLVADDAILATNTSALSVGAIDAAATGHPDRVIGLHFFNPAPIMPLVEVVAGPWTASTVVDAAAALVDGWSRTPIRCTDEPGFVVNRVNRPFTIQALRLLETGQASTGQIDAAARSEGFPMGPFELMDLVGIDVNLAATTGIWNGFGRPERFRPSTIQADLVAAGRLGRKTGEGFYRYDSNGARLGPAPEFEGAVDAARLADQALAVIEVIRLALANEAFLALDAGVAADEATIDLALRIGANHPQGPFAWARGRGLAGVVAALERLSAGDAESFEPAPGLRRAARTIAT